VTWIMYHTKSENYASLAEVAVKQGDLERANQFYRLAAEQEEFALRELDVSKQKTVGITTVSAASLWFKAHEFQKAQIVAHKGLASALPAFAVNQLQSILQAIWNEEALAKAGVKFTKGDVLVSVSGGEIVTGGAPLELILYKVGEIKRFFYRTIEMLLDFPFRRRGDPVPEIQEQFRPWLFQAPAGSYQFAVRIEKPRQMFLFPDAGPNEEKITQKFLEIVRASADDLQEDLITIVPNEEYRERFLKLTRSLAPTGVVFSKLEIKSSEIGSRPIVLIPTSREVINQALRKTQSEQQKLSEPEEKQLQGILRALDLDGDWLEINLLDEENQKIRIYETGDVIDDEVGPMVNRRVKVNVVERPKGGYAYRDIQLEE
jgi:hypothetical protein